MTFLPHVVFDLDGTLVDSLPGIQWSVEAALAETGIPARHRDLKPLIGPPIRRILAELSGVSEEPALDRLERAFRSSYDSSGWRRTVCCEGALATLRALMDSGLSLYLVTNKPAPATIRILRSLRLAPFFQEIVCRDSRIPVFESKAEMLLDLLRRRGFSAAESLMVGDTLEDAHASLAAGMPCALVPHGYGRGLDNALPANCLRIRAWSELVQLWDAPRAAGVNPWNRYSQSLEAAARLGEQA